MSPLAASQDEVLLVPSRGVFLRGKLFEEIVRPPAKQTEAKQRKAEKGAFGPIMNIETSVFYTSTEPFHFSLQTSCSLHVRKTQKRPIFTSSHLKQPTTTFSKPFPAAFQVPSEGCLPVRHQLLLRTLLRRAPSNSRLAQDAPLRQLF